MYKGANSLFISKMDYKNFVKPMIKDNKIIIGVYIRVYNNNKIGIFIKFFN